MRKPVRWTPESLIQAGIAETLRLGRAPRVREFAPSSSARRYFGTHSKFIQEVQCAIRDNPDYCDHSSAHAAHSSRVGHAGEAEGEKPKTNVDEILFLYEKLGNKTHVARELGLSRSWVTEVINDLQSHKPLAGGTKHGLRTETRPIPKTGVKRYILTCAQSNTYVNRPVWNNLLALANFYSAEILVSRFTYNKGAYGTKSVKPGCTPTQEDLDEVWFDSVLAQDGENYFCDKRVKLARDLVFCGEMNILPTASDPLSGLDTYTGTDSCIIPHVKVAMRSVPTGKYEATKFIYTTSTVTKRNYVAKKEGLKAEFHHTYGGVIVEVDSAGDWFVRQLNADDSDAIYDLDVFVSNGEVTSGHTIKSINWGDLHRAQMDPVQSEVQVKIRSELKPEYQICHDLCDCLARNPHFFRTRKNSLQRFRAYQLGYDIVEDEIAEIARWLDENTTNGITTVVVSSNHDRGLLEWLGECDYRSDPQNALFFLRAQTYVYEEIASDPDAKVNVLAWACKDILGDRKDVVFLDVDESFILCGVELGMHFDIGPNGARGTPANLKRLARKATGGHVHSAGIWDGLYAAGYSGKTEQGYNNGPSSWSHTHTAMYRNGKRVQITCRNNKYRG